MRCEVPCRKTKMFTNETLLHSCSSELHHNSLGVWLKGLDSLPSFCTMDVSFKYNHPDNPFKDNAYISLNCFVHLNSHCSSK